MIHIPRALPVVVMAALAVAGALFFLNKSSQSISNNISCRPWQCVGGCGTSAGGAGNTGAQIRWIGQGTAGAMFDAEVLGSTLYLSNPHDSIMPRKSVSALTPSLYVHLRHFDLQVSLPLSYRYASVEKKINQTGVWTAGAGDLAADVSVKLGTGGQIVPHVGLSFPTGKADSYNRFEVLPSDMQGGTGRFGGWLGLDYFIDFDWGIICIAPNYSGGVAYLKTVDWRYDRVLSRGIPVKKTLASARVSQKTAGGSLFGAKNDMGVVASDRLTLAGYAGIKQGMVTHGIGVSLGISMGDNAYQDFNYDKWLQNSSDQKVDTSTCKDRASAQAVAEQSTTIAYNFVTGQMETVPRYSNPVVVGRDSIYWKVRQATQTVVKNHPILGLQYSAEVLIKRVPLLFGVMLPLTIGDGGNVFNSVSATVGVRFPVY